MKESLMKKTPNDHYLPPLSWHILTPLYDFCCAVTGLGPRFKKKVLAAAPLKDGMTVIDVGCGTGVFLKIAKQKFPRVQFIGIDPDEAALEIAERRFQQSECTVELKRAFGQSLPLSDESIDVCFSVLALHHMPEDVKQKAIQEMYRVLKHDGRVVIADIGETKSLFFRKLHLLEKVEHMEGNFNGMIPRYLKAAGFQSSEVVGSHFPGIHILHAKKN